MLDLAHTLRTPSEVFQSAYDDGPLTGYDAGRWGCARIGSAR